MKSSLKISKDLFAKKKDATPAANRPQPQPQPPGQPSSANPVVAQSAPATPAATAHAATPAALQSAPTERPIPTLNSPAPVAQRPQTRPLHWLAWLGWGSCALLLLAALGYTLWEYNRFSQIDQHLPYGTTIGEVPVGGLLPAESMARVQRFYAQPIKIQYQSATFNLIPQQVGFTLKTDIMLQQVIPASANLNFLQYLIGQRPYSAQNIALQADYDHAKLTMYLQDIANRYDPPSYPAFANPKNLITYRAKPGEVLDMNTASLAIEEALFQHQNRQVILKGETAPEEILTLAMLETQLESYLADLEFKGLLSFYLHDLKRDQITHFNLYEGKKIRTEPDIAFSGMSIMKITVLTEFYRQLGPEGALPYELEWVRGSITKSSNYTSNLMINWAGDLDDNAGLYRINQTLTALKLENTFLGGLYDSLEPPGFRFTPANQATDFTTQPDAYMQTTASDMGKLLTGIYQCAYQNRGVLLETFPKDFNAQKCIDMIDWLSQNKIAALIEAGVPEGTKVAHKHAWAAGEPIGDAGLVFTPGGDYVLTYYVWHPEYTYWDENSRLLANISRAVYSFFNPATQ